jgi:hypothetical protein
MKTSLFLSLKTLPLAIFGLMGTISLSATGVSAAAINLNTWTAEGQSEWIVDEAGTSVLQTINGSPTFFTSDFAAKGLDLSGNIKVEPGGWDDDFIGFALGFNPGDKTNSTADFLLIDWKKANQSDYLGLGVAGLAVSRVTGVTDAFEYWTHADSAGTSGKISELARATNLGNMGWNYGQDYGIKFNFTDTNLKVYLNDSLELDVNGDFSNINGNFAFYNHSQENVRYSGFQSNPLPPEDVPEPITGLVVAAGMGGAALRRIRKPKKSQ